MDLASITTPLRLVLKDDMCSQLKLTALWLLRAFYLGDAMLRGNPAGQKWWTLPEVVERMRASYCGSLTAEFDHLPSE